jgi:hypothetical protein
MARARRSGAAHLFVNSFIDLPIQFGITLLEEDGAIDSLQVSLQQQQLAARSATMADPVPGHKYHRPRSTTPFLVINIYDPAPGHKYHRDYDF